MTAILPPDVAGQVLVCAVLAAWGVWIAVGVVRHVRVRRRAARWRELRARRVRWIRACDALELTIRRVVAHSARPSAVRPSGLPKESDV